MVRLLQPSSWIVCLRGWVLHQSRFRYLRSVMCSASWLDSSTSSAGIEVPFPLSRCLEPDCCCVCICSESLGWSLSGGGIAPWDPRFLFLPSAVGSRNPVRRNTAPMAYSVRTILRGVGCSSGARLGGGSSAGRGGAERCGSLGGAGGVRARSHPGVHRGRGWDPAYKLQQRRAVSHLNVSQLRSPLQAPPDHWTSASAPFNTSINFH